eukprot:TRINITY_DN6841_c0_g1_i2.p1 TRINITY_DN6841_c0_g1~~TRINITY_DN6841_c0_g1_i2.p1  ORF type:complete len:268 (+),score=8.46 TRINITY_DN6841_c0_g1_i2:65-868(+)
MPQWRFLPNITWLTRACGASVASETLRKADAVVPRLAVDNQVQRLPAAKSTKAKEPPPLVAISEPATPRHRTATPRKDSYSLQVRYALQVPGTPDEDMALSPDRLEERASDTTGTHVGDLAPRVSSEEVAVGMACECKQCEEGADDTCSTFSLLSTSSVRAYLGKRKRARRTNDDAWLDLENGRFDGMWIRSPNASDVVPPFSFAWARGFKIKGGDVVLGNGEDAMLQTCRGRILLMNCELVRVGDRLLLYGHTFTLVYQIVVEACT